MEHTISNNNRLPLPDPASTVPLLWGDKRYYALDFFLKETFGEKVYRLSLNGGMTCPNREAPDSSGCIFCSAGGAGEFAAPPALPIAEQIIHAKANIRAKSDCQTYIAYFQAFTNTYAPTDYLGKIFLDAIKAPEIAALSIATRCDCLPDDVLDLLEELNHIKPVWVELGLQTIHEVTLKEIRSGFTLHQYETAVSALRARNIAVITHLILGLPDETREMMKASVSYIARLPIQGVKLHLLHILENTLLGTRYKEKPFPLFTLEEYCDFIVDCVELLPPKIVIHRLTGDGPRSLLIAPRWSTDKKRVLNTIQKRFRERDTWQGKYFDQNEI